MNEIILSISFLLVLVMAFSILIGRMLIIRRLCFIFASVLFTTYIFTNYSTIQSIFACVCFFTSPILGYVLFVYILKFYSNHFFKSKNIFNRSLLSIQTIRNSYSFLFDEI
jgi:hypothetical protein